MILDWNGSDCFCVTISILREAEVRFQKFTKFATKIIARQSDGDSRLQEADFGSAIEPLTLELEPIYGPTFGELLGDRSGELDFTPGPSLRSSKVLHDV